MCCSELPVTDKLCSVWSDLVEFCRERARARARALFTSGGLKSVGCVHVEGGRGRIYLAVWLCPPVRNVADEFGLLVLRVLPLFLEVFLLLIALGLLLLEDITVSFSKG